jgi:prevent-host-death family protein
MEWQLADAKNRLSEVVSRALDEGPQFVRRRDDVVVIVALQEYEQLTGKRLGFKEFLAAKGPSLAGVDLTRDRSPVRGVKL